MKKSCGGQHFADVTVIGNSKSEDHGAILLARECAIELSLLLSPSRGVQSLC
jgi:hypothetical protein